MSGTKKSDMIFVASYAITFILLGIWLLLFGLGYFELAEAFFLFLASEGLVILAMGGLRTRESPQGSGLAMGFGGMVFMCSLIVYFILGDVLTLTLGVATVFIVAGILILLLYLTRFKVED